MQGEREVEGLCAYQYMIKKCESDSEVDYDITISKKE